MTKPYYLFIDDERDLDFHEVAESGCDITLPWIVVRSTAEAKKVVMVKGRLPSALALDHDLGGNDTVMVFLKWLEQYCEDSTEVPEYTVHSANFVGRANIRAFMRSWKKSREMNS